MLCPKCGHDTQVKDSRPFSDGSGVRRRRFCPSCSNRFSTYEISEMNDRTAKALSRGGIKVLKEEITKSQNSINKSMEALTFIQFHIERSSR